MNAPAPAAAPANAGSPGGRATADSEAVNSTPHPFAAAMHEAGANPARKAAPTKASAAAAGGAPLPGRGNVAPQTAPSLPRTAKSAALDDGLTADVAAEDAKSVLASAPAPLPSVTLPDNSPATALSGTPSAAAAATAASAASIAAGQTLAAAASIAAGQSLAASASNPTAANPAASTAAPTSGGSNLNAAEAALAGASTKGATSADGMAAVPTGSGANAGLAAEKIASETTPQTAPPQGAPAPIPTALPSAASTANDASIAAGTDSPAATADNALDAASAGGKAKPTPASSAPTALGQSDGAANATPLVVALPIVTAAPTADADKLPGGAVKDAAPAQSTTDAGAAQAELSANGASAAANDASPASVLKMTAGLDTPEFSQAMANHVSYMVDNGINGAKIQINPPELGPIEVRVSVQGDHAQVWLSAQSSLTRDALESSSPRLRDMLSAQGFGQVNVDVSQRSFQERAPYQQPLPSSSYVDRGDSSPLADASTAQPRASLGAVDAYA